MNYKKLTKDSRVIKKFQYTSEPITLFTARVTA